MTTSDLSDLIAACDLGDRTDRLVLADAMEEAGRRKEAKRLRGGRELTLEGGEILAVNYEVRYVGAPYGLDEGGELMSGHKSASAAATALAALRKASALYYGSNAAVFRVVGNDLRRERI